MVEKNYALTITLISFAVLYSAYRIWDVFAKQYGERGKVYYRWTLTGLTIFHFLGWTGAVVEYFAISRAYNLLIGLIATVAFIFAHLLRTSAIRALGKFHSQHIEIKPFHKLVTSPPYQNLRHPYYLAVILEVLSIPLFLNSFYSLLFVSFAYAPMVIIRLRLEEKVLMQSFKEDYLKYKNSVNALFPHQSKLRLFQ